MPAVELEADAPDVKVEGETGSLAGKLAAGAAAAVGVALGAVALSGKDSEKTDVEVCKILGRWGAELSTIVLYIGIRVLRPLVLSCCCGWW